MHNDKNDLTGDYNGDDATTGEYPVLFDAIGEPTGALPVLDPGATDVSADRAREPTQSEAQVSSWLTDLEAEIARLHDRWQQVEQGFNAKDGLIAELKTEIASRDATLGDVRVQLNRHAEALKAIERSLADKDDEVANLSAEIGRRAQTEERNAAALAAVTAERHAAQRELEAARADIARLNAALEREQAAVRTLVERNERLVATQATMTLRIQELETYIDGRAQGWSVLKAQISEQKNKILHLERKLKTKEAEIDGSGRSRRELEQKVVDLERQNLEMSGRRNERDAAYEELQRKLMEHFALAEQLKADLANRVADHDRLLSSATADRTQIATLEAALREKDGALAALEAQLAADRSIADERLRTLERDLAERDVALVQSRELADRQLQLATDLKTELDAKRTSVDLLQRSVHRITHLGASLAELERRIESSSSARAADSTGVPTVDALPSIEVGSAELLPLESFLDVGGDEELARRAARAPQLIGSVGGENVSFPLSKGEMTIGRGKASDIRIPSHFISRAHAKISTRGIATTIEDIGSKNGIFVNASRVRRCVLRDGDVVSLASELELRFVDAVH